MATHAIEAVVTATIVAGVGVLVGSPLLPATGPETALAPPVASAAQVSAEAQDLLALTHSVKWERYVEEPAWPTF